MSVQPAALALVVFSLTGRGAAVHRLGSLLFPKEIFRGVSEERCGKWNLSRRHMCCFGKLIIN